MELHSSRERALSLFKYLFQLCSQKQARSIVTDIDREPVGQEQMRIFAQDIPDSPAYVSLHSRDSAGDEPDGTLLLSIRKPGSRPCPAPDDCLIAWLAPGWQDYRRDAKHLPYIERTAPQTPMQTALPGAQETAEHEQLAMPPELLSGQDTVVREDFEAEESRVAAWTAWSRAREAWCAVEREKERVKDCFSALYAMYNLLQRDRDNYELLVGNGLLTDRRDARFSHPVLLRKARISLRPADNVLLVTDEETDSELYSLMLNQMEGIQTGVLPEYEEMLREQDVHPFDATAAGDYLRALAASLGSNCCYLPDASETARPSDRFAISWKPVFFVRKRIDGSLATLSRIIEAIEQGAPVPDTLSGITGVPVGPRGADALPVDDADILLPKPANREQLDIAREIAGHAAVLVQGPPGTGKTHTIANLMGHFLAQGKSVLVTSQTSKALRVLKDKVPDAVKSLCVAVLEDSNRDMERSVEDIVDTMATLTPEAALRQAEELRAERGELLNRLSAAKDRAFRIRNREFQPIVLDGESWSPARAAAYIADHAEQLSVIPGDVAFDAVFPLDDAALAALYASNAQLTAQEEAELGAQLPDPGALMTPQALRIFQEQRRSAGELIRRQGEALGKELVFHPVSGTVTDALTGEAFILAPALSHVAQLERQLLPYQERCESCPWIAQVIADSSESGSRIALWQTLAAAIADTYAYAESLVGRLFGRRIELGGGLSLHELTEACQALYDAAQRKGRVPRPSLLMPKAQRTVLAQVKLDGGPITTADDLRLILDDLELLRRRESLALQWDALMAANGERRFAELGEEPERYCHVRLPELSFFLTWLSEARPRLIAGLEAAGLQGGTKLFLLNAACLTRESAQAELRRFCVRAQACLRIFQLLAKDAELEAAFERTRSALAACRDSALCARLLDALTAHDADRYALELRALTQVLGKQPLYARRQGWLRAVGAVCPAWARAIAERTPPHDGAAVPEGLYESFRLRRLDAVVRDIASTPLSEVEREIWQLNGRLQEVTAALASELAWVHTLRRVQESPEIQQALNGWKMTLRKIGKGTGKHAPRWRREAQRLMGVCQRAVPAWIMPVSRVMDTINPQTTHFDIVIIDEASQCDPTAIALLFMADRAIVVGDDRQVSPMAIGVDSDIVSSLISTYIQDVIPNAHLFSLDDSLYNIVSMSYKPLLLREHFRCVPDIIGYSNALSYDNRIIPLREAGSAPVQPGVVACRVPGTRGGRAKTNLREAETIVALMMACMEQEEYAGESFGAISLLGQEQVKLIDRLLFEHVDIAERERRQILCGDASNFQGDERDVVFLSLVDSGDSDGPLRMLTEGRQESNRQRYNVAASRARDQLFIVHSLDSSRDLKAGDLRRDLLEYAEHPHAGDRLLPAVAQKAESPFEREVAGELARRGYHLIQQYAVGAYRIDMIALYRTKKVAIECDGEQFHSSGEAIRADMERQGILERLGWRFIRIRGSEYYRDREAAMQRVVRELGELGIRPEQSEDSAQHGRDGYPLLERVKRRAARLLDEWHGLTASSDADATGDPNTAPAQIIVQVPVPEDGDTDAEEVVRAPVIDDEDTDTEEVVRMPVIEDEDTDPEEVVYKPVLESKSVQRRRRQDLNA